MRDFELYYTKDGSIGLYSYSYNDVYHSKFGALSEAWEKFVLPSNISTLLTDKQNINVLDVCYGIGYNTKAFLSAVLFDFENKKNKKINENKNLKIKLKKIFLKNKNLLLHINNDSIGNDNNFINQNKLLESIETINNDNINFGNPVTNNNIQKNILINDKKLSIKKIKLKIFINEDKLKKVKINNDKILEIKKLKKRENYKFPQISIDCIEKDEILVKLSPFIKNPEAITKFDYFNYYLECILGRKSKLRGILKADNLFVNNKCKYYLSDLVNNILLKSLYEESDELIFDIKGKKLFKELGGRKYFDPSAIKLSKFLIKKGYKLSSKNILTAYLHNIYYEYLSKRYRKTLSKLNKLPLKIKFYINDARIAVKELTKKYDLIYLDAFTYTKAPELWSYEFVNNLYNLLAPDGLIITYSSSALVRNTFLMNNFYVGKIIDPITNKSVGTIAAKNKELIKKPLNDFELGLCSTKSGIPYHDINLNNNAEQIIVERGRNISESKLITASQYIKKSRQEVYYEK